MDSVQNVYADSIEKRQRKEEEKRTKDQGKWLIAMHVSKGRNLCKKIWLNFHSIITLTYY